MKHGSNQKFYRTEVRLICLLLSLLLLCPAVLPSPAVAAVSVPTDATLVKQTAEIHEKALQYTKKEGYGSLAGNGYTTFASLCACYVSVQLILLGVNNDYMYGNGKDMYDNYKNMSYSSGGRKIHAYPAAKWSISNALRDINAKSRVATNILLGFQTTSSSAGQKYGHVMLIHGIIDGYVYYTENSATQVAGKSYKEGAPIKCTISEFSSNYARASVYGFEGIIWFEDEKLSAAVGAGQTSYEDDPPAATEDPGSQTGSFTPGVYRVTYPGGLRIRASATTASETLEILSYNASVNVTSILSNWGSVFCTVDGKQYGGWICLDYAEKTGELLPVAVERTGTGGVLLSRIWYNSLNEAIGDAGSGTTVRLFADAPLRQSVTLDAGKTLETGTYRIVASAGAVLSVRGGTLISEGACEAVKNDPFLKTAVSGTKTTYTCPYSLQIRQVGLAFENGVALRFVTGGTLPANLTGVTAELICDDFYGESRTFTADGTVRADMDLTSDPIPVAEMMKKITAGVRLSCRDGDRTFTLCSQDVTFSPAEYVGTLYGSDPKLDRVLAALMNYATAVQKANGASPANYVNLVLPASARDTAVDASVLREAGDAPVGLADAAVHICTASLDAEAGVCLRFGTDKPETNGMKLLVFSAADYAALKRSGGDVVSRMTEQNATCVLSPEKDGSFVYDRAAIKEFADTVYFRLCVSGTAGGAKYDNVFSFSVTEYCRRVADTGATGAVRDMCLYLCELTAAAGDYFNYAANGGRS